MAFDRTLLASFAQFPGGFAPAPDGQELPEYLTPELLHRFYCMALYWGYEEEGDYLTLLVFTLGRTTPLIKVIDNNSAGGSYGMMLIPTVGSSIIHVYQNPRLFRLKNGMLLTLDDFYRKLNPEMNLANMRVELESFANRVETFAATKGLMHGKDRVTKPVTEW